MLFLRFSEEKVIIFVFLIKKRAKLFVLQKKSCTFASHLSIGLWCNGNTADSGPAFPGSNPGSPTRQKVLKFQSLLFVFVYL